MKLNILHISCGGLGHGGVSAVIFSIVEPLCNDVNFDCVVFKKHCDKEKEFEKYGNLYRINAYNDNGKRNFFEMFTRPFRLYFGIRKICANKPYDVIHCHNLFDEGICLLAAKHSKVPIRIAHSHNTLAPKKTSFFSKIISKVVMRINRLLMKYSATDFVACSSAAADSFFGVVNKQVIYNSVDLDRFSPCANKVINPLTFIHVGRYAYQKNQVFVIDVFEKLLLKYPDSKLLLVGFGEDEEKLKNIINYKKLNSSIEMIPGNLVDVSKLYDQANYMIFPSIYEGFGIVLIEAQSKRIPCFVSEAIQREADVGLLTYISLQESAAHWANEIINYIELGGTIDEEALNNKLMMYSKQNIAVQYLNLYKGNKYEQVESE